MAKSSVTDDLLVRICDAVLDLTAAVRDLTDAVCDLGNEDDEEEADGTCG